MAPRTRNGTPLVEASNMCQTTDDSTRGIEVSPEAMMHDLELLRREVQRLRELNTLVVDASWLTAEINSNDEDLDSLLDNDSACLESEDLSKLPPAPKFPSPRDPAFKLIGLPMWLSTFKLAASTVLHRIHGTPASKRATFAFWMSQINSELNHPELHKILHTAYQSLNTTISEIKNAFGFSQERFERYVRQKIMNFELGEHEYLRPLWQKFKTSYKDALRLNLISSGDKNELLNKVREICALCPSLQDRVGNLLRLRIVTSEGITHEPSDPISFDRVASIIDHSMDSLEEERGQPLRREAPRQSPSQDRKREDTRGRPTIHPGGQQQSRPQPYRPPYGDRNEYRAPQNTNPQVTSNYPLKRQFEGYNSTVKVRRVNDEMDN